MFTPQEPRTYSPSQKGSPILKNPKNHWESILCHNIELTKNALTVVLQSWLPTQCCNTQSHPWPTQWYQDIRFYYPYLRIWRITATAFFAIILRWQKLLSQWFFRCDYLQNAAVLIHIPDRHIDVHICSIKQLFSISEGKDWEIKPFPSSIFFREDGKGFISQSSPNLQKKREMLHLVYCLILYWQHSRRERWLCLIFKSHLPLPICWHLSAFYR